MKKTVLPESDDIFKKRVENLQKRSAPLADRMRPRTLEEFIGQEHILGPGRLLRRAIQIDQLSSLIFYGPPGTGKTTLARIIANTTKAQFITINAVLAGVKEIREAIEKAQEYLSLYEKRTILFIDEVHRFNKAQQDALLPHVESGLITLIGATTENPYFEVNKALVSRSRIFQLRSLGQDDLKTVVLQALNDTERGYGKLKIEIDPDGLEHMVKTANGDARAVLNALELAVETTPTSEDGVIRIDRSIIEESIQKRAVLYDRDGDAHYDTVSAFIKSIRGSDPDAALYWMAKMLYAGEDPRFIFRRMLILACEDVGMADPKALGIVMDAARAFDYVGLPEGRYHLAHACIYLSTAPKSNSSMAFFDALETVRKQTEDEVPNHLCDSTRDSEGFGHGAGYLYPHAYRDHWVAQQYLPSSLQGKVFYQPSDQGYEKTISEAVARRREAQLEAMAEEDDSSPLTCTKEKRHDSSLQQWMKRSLGMRGAMLEKTTERLLGIAALQPSDIVLDLYTRTGIIAFAASRIIREGGVWAIAHSRDSFITATALAERLDILSRPHIIESSWNSFENDLFKAAGDGIRFDKILGRNIFTKVNDRETLLRRITALLADEGHVMLAEAVPSAAQRLSALIEFTEEEHRLKAALLECEERLFCNPDDPMVNWDSSLLYKTLSAISGVSVEIFPKKVQELRQIKPADIEFWFRITSQEAKRKSLGDLCIEKYGDPVLKRLKELFHSRLDYKHVPWNTETLYIDIRKTHHGA